MIYKSLGELVKLSQGLAVNKGNSYLFSDNESEDYPYPLLRIVDFGSNKRDNFSKYVSKEVSSSVIIDEKDIVFTRVTFECFRGYSGVLHNNLFSVEIVDDCITEDYLYTVLQSDFVKAQAQNLTSSSVVPDLNHEMFKAIRIPVPDKNFQKYISDIYLRINDKIENNNKINDELESMAKTIYDYWFLQFEFPNEEGKPYKSSGGAMVWDEELQRDIPEGWGNYDLNYFMECNKHSLKDGVYKYIQYVDTGSLTKNRLENIVRISDGEKIPSRAQRVVKKNDILFSTVRPNQCHYGIVKIPVDNMIASTGFTILSCKQGSKYNELFYLCLISDYNMNLLQTIADSSTSSYPSISPNDILGIKIVLPPHLDMLENCCGVFGDIYYEIHRRQKENQELVSLRDFLLPMLMNGQVTFKSGGESQ